MRYGTGVSWGLSYGDMYVAQFFKYKNILRRMFAILCTKVNTSWLTLAILQPPALL